MPVFKQRCQLLLYKQVVRQLSQPAQGQSVMYKVCHFNAAGYLLKVVLMVPDIVGAGAGITWVRCIE